MEQPDLKNLKMVIRSILTSSPSKLTILQLLNDYLYFEDFNLPYQHLGFKTIYELLENMNDVLKIPSNPNMNSLVTLIVDEKTSHLRELVVNQKSKKQRSRRNNSSGRGGNNYMYKSSNFKSRDYNYNTHITENNSSMYEYTAPRCDNSIHNSSRGYEYGSHRYDNSARGYDHVKIKPLSKTPGTVTPNLRSFIENLCNTSGSEKITINKLKTCLINHPDYNKLGTTNIEESINMLKYFIYIDKGGVHLKDSPHEIFPSKTSNKSKCTIPTSSNYLSSIVNESEEISYSELNDDDYDEMDDSSFGNLKVYGVSISEYNSHFSFSEYGFSSMRDMAYKLPSVFYVKVTEDNHECILFEACRRNELENDLDDPSLFYKKIPKTILNNLSNFFDKYRNGVKLNELLTLYCAEYGRAYEPLKYGYTSEKHMFESLDKMVEVKNNELFTINHLAYKELSENIDHTDDYDNISVVLPNPDFLLHYSGNDICNGRFKYPKVKFDPQKSVNVIVAEIYNPSSFYIQLAAEVNNLNSLMDSLQLFYKKNETKYKVLPQLILQNLACTSCFEDSGLWHRATVMKIVDDKNVQLLYVDYGSIEIVPKENVRLLASQFGMYPAQGVHCSLHKFNALNYPREISESFAEMVENHELEAQFHPPISDDDSKKKNVTLFFSNEIMKHLHKHQESVRRLIYKVIEENK
ncbi:PREDICTED: uncharacterized protein LOC107166201 [Diuraphis noxia]|uniref:uncharacterized protein LOC107166201 n=1 Tax=Diuraphis noxia TaxID=143948 RepID=UPI00076360AD|nr:PREDICTED: uncharacterized protein LOC107166201 [Diuraphis noxia]